MSTNAIYAERFVAGELADDEQVVRTIWQMLDDAVLDKAHKHGLVDEEGALCRGKSDRQVETRDRLVRLRVVFTPETADEPHVRTVWIEGTGDPGYDGKAMAVPSAQPLGFVSFAGEQVAHVTLVNTGRFHVVAGIALPVYAPE